jgi:hypothetical protein
MLARIRWHSCLVDEGGAECQRQPNSEHHSEAPRVIAVGLMRRERLQSLISLPALDADDRPPTLQEPVVEHRSHPAGLEYDPPALRRLRELLLQIRSRRGYLGLRLPRRVIDHADVRLLHRDIQASKILHDQSPLPTVEPILSASAEELLPITQC